MDKHAFLIMSRDFSCQLNILLKSLDYANNDIFLHVDKKSKSTKKSLRSLENASITLLPRMEANWAAYSLLQVEINLLKSAISKGHYRYYHLLSEKDLPIKSNIEIHRFFEDKNDEFVEINEINSKMSLRRIKFFYPLQERIGKKHGFFWAIQKLFMYLQMICHINRLTNKDNIQFAKGSQWFSITDDFARYLVDSESQIFSIFHSGQTVDEMFVQTVLLNSKFYVRRGKCNTRFIKWKRKNSPEILSGNADLKQIKESDAFFARKFDIDVDDEIVNDIVKGISGR